MPVGVGVNRRRWLRRRRAALDQPAANPDDTGAISACGSSRPSGTRPGNGAAMGWRATASGERGGRAAVVGSLALVEQKEDDTAVTGYISDDTKAVGYEFRAPGGACGEEQEKALTAAAFTGPRDRAEKKGACAERHGWCDRSRERRETRLVRLEPRARVVVSQALPTLADGRTRSVGRLSHSATVNSGKYARAAQRLSRDCSWPWERPRAPLECGRDPEGRPR
ncbi:hypothetical protein NDU88_008034 [Pleurodeles waltl]|uniref:Uncharacterized protein n=1 Tax=Pleurodeles waltl TaxID=8319 RepID=A0AAV7PN54_PLEWA|nr:hypothetical protein NDU88_008034 [Pleurodeles waltl]